MGGPFPHHPSCTFTWWTSKRPCHRPCASCSSPHRPCHQTKNLSRHPSDNSPDGERHHKYCTHASAPVGNDLCTRRHSKHNTPQHSCPGCCCLPKTLTAVVLSSPLAFSCASTPPTHSPPTRHARYLRGGPFGNPKFPPHCAWHTKPVSASPVGTPWPARESRPTPPPHSTP